MPQLTSINNLEVIVNKDVSKKYGGLADTYQGEVLATVAGLGVPVRLTADYFTTIPITLTRHRMSSPSSGSGMIPTMSLWSRRFFQWVYLAFTVSSNHHSIFQALRDEEEKWPLLSHPNLCPLWRLSSPIEDILVIGTPWFMNGNVMDFIRQNPAVNKLKLVCYLPRGSLDLLTHCPRCCKSLERLNISTTWVSCMETLYQYVSIWRSVRRTWPLSQTNIMIAHDGSALLADVGLNACLSKATYDEAWPVPFWWMLKAAEELQYENDPVSFVHTMAMDVCAFANTVHTVRLPRLFKSDLALTCHVSLTDRYIPQIFPTLRNRTEVSWSSWRVDMYSKDRWRSQKSCGIFCSYAGPIVPRTALPS